MWVTIKKWVLFVLILSITGFFAYQWYQYRQVYDRMPAGTLVAGLDVSGLTRDEIIKLLNETYSGPVFLYHRNESIELDPASVGFVLDSEQMLKQLDEQFAAQEEWRRFATFIVGMPLLKTIQVPLIASHDQAGLKAMLESIGDFLDKPAMPAQMLTDGKSLGSGEAGYILDVEASLPAAEAVLYEPVKRAAQLTVRDQEAPEMNLSLLQETIETKLQGFDGIGSIFVMDLSTGEELNINADMAMSGLSILKIAIFEEAYRALDDPPNAYVQQLFLDTATRSSNFGANLLLHVVAGEENTYKGADILTESMQKLGLVNTFMAVPYDASPPSYRRTTYLTPANSAPELATSPDETMQSTASEIGTLLSMIYYCSKGGGTLLAVYPNQITPDECQEIIDLMVLNEEGNLIRYGVPDDVPVSHKHGWARATHADAGIVFSPGGDFILVEYLTQPGDWLLADQSFPILREIARATYNYFNPDNPYLGDAFRDRDIIDPENPFSEQSASPGQPANQESQAEQPADDVQPQTTEEAPS